MTETDTSETPTLGGAVRVDERIPQLAARLEPGEIAVIEAADLDRSSALSLLTRRPMAVLNAAPSTTGRRSSLGAQLLVDGGIVVIDDLGPDLMVLHEGDSVQIIGGDVYRNGEMVASGQRRTHEDLRSQQGRERLAAEVRAFAQGAAITWDSESSVLLEGDGVPALEALRGVKNVVVVSPSDSTEQRLRQLARWARDFSPAVIAVAESADQCGPLRTAPSVIVGDPSGVSEKVLRNCGAIVLLERPDGSTPGLERVSNLGLSYFLMQTSASPTDAAILLSDVNGVEMIVTAGDEEGIPQFLDRSSAEMTSGFFIRTRCQDRMVSSTVACALYRPRISSWQLAFLILAALAVLFVAILFTPWGADASFWLGDRISGIWSGQSAGAPTFAPPAI